MGIGGVVFGCGTLSYFNNGQHVTPISPLGFAVATGGAFVLLFFYRLLGGYWFVEDDGGGRRSRRHRHRRLGRRPYDSSAIYEE